MIYGASRKTWTMKFAWRPVKLMDGRMVWLEYVMVTSYYNPAVSAHCVYNVRFWRESFVARLPGQDYTP